MNDLTPTPSHQRSSGYSATADVTVELAKMLALVAPITMTTQQQEIWLRAAIDSLQDIRPDELASVSLEVRRSVTRPSQIVPEIARLVAEHRARRSMVRQFETPLLEGPPLVRHIMERDRAGFTADDWAELNEYLELQGSCVRYQPDGTRFMIEPL